MTWRVLALTVGLSVLGGTAWAGDHADTPYLAVDGSVDLTDLYAWTTTSTATGEHTLNLAMTIRSHPPRTRSTHSTSRPERRWAWQGWTPT
ncbi:MAG: hypothetical protein H6730_31755 [Deltaproteobacteria bacterium]|nr:hypothetical protein [Deltaproteobacteria bacterium]